MFQNPITPKSLTALQRLLQQNTPKSNSKQVNLFNCFQLLESDFQLNSLISFPQTLKEKTKRFRVIRKQKNIFLRLAQCNNYSFFILKSQISLSQSIRNEHQIKSTGDPLSKILSQQIRPTQDMKAEILRVLHDEKSTKKTKKKKSTPQSKPMQAKQLQKYFFNSRSLNQLLQPHGQYNSVDQIIKKEEINSERNAANYKEKRPPELYDLGLQEDQSKQVAKNCYTVKQSPQHFTFNSEVIQKKNNGFYTTTNARVRGAVNQQGSLNEMLKQYIQAKSSVEKQVAGTGEGIRINEKNQCHSARSQQQKKFMMPEQAKSTPRRISNNQQLGENFDKIYLKAAKLLNAFKAKELEWKQEKKRLKEEVQFLKELLKQQQQELFNEQSSEDCLPEEQYQADNDFCYY